MKVVWRAFGILMLAGVAVPAAAQVESPATNGAWAAAKLLFSLLIVVGAIFAAAWAIKRIGPPRPANALIRVLAAVPLGPRERLVLVEIGETWFVLGVAQGNIQTLHSMPKQPGLFDSALARNRWFERRRV